MKLGDLVKSSSYKELENGKIIDITTINDSNYYEVFFPKTKETLTLEEKDLEPIYSPLERLKNANFDNPLLFRLRILSEKIQSLLYQDKIISANNFKIMPLPHQIVAVNHVLEQFKPRCLIADEVGLGKTIEAALIYEELKLRNIAKRVLIVVPAGLTTQWRDELKTKFNEDFYIIDRNSCKTLRDLHGNINIWKKYDKVITSLDFLKYKSVYKDLSEKVKKRREDHNENITNACVNAGWDICIFDEGHKLSKASDGAETSRYKLGEALSETVPIFLLLTATPHQGDGVKFMHLLSLLDPYKFYSIETLNPENVRSVCVKNSKRSATDFKGNLLFKSRITSVVKIPRDTEDIEVQLYKKVSKYVSEYYELASRENNFTFMFLLILYQRMVSSSSRAILNSLSKRLEILKQVSSAGFKINQRKMKKLGMEDVDDLSIEDSNKFIDDFYTFFEGSTFQLDANEAVMDISNMHNDMNNIQKEIEVLESCVSLAKKTSYGRRDFKVRKTLEIIDEIKNRENDPQVKVLIFTEFVDTQFYLGHILEEMGYKVAYLNGRMNLEKKIEAKTSFKEDCQILISTDSGGEGINLQFCHVIINYDLPWNPMKIEQRIGRLDRIGQKKDVLVFNYVLENTVEDRVHDVLQEKLESIASQFGDDKKADVLNMLQEEFNFDKIYIDALRYNQKKIPELENVGKDIFNRAKEILENDDYLLPFNKPVNTKQISNSLVKNEADVVKSLVQSYAELRNSKLVEYSKKKNVYYSEMEIANHNIRNVVFDKELAMENEAYDFVNLTHPIVNQITEEIIDKESLTFNVEIPGDYGKEGVLFFYRLDLTNNLDFLRRELIPIFISNAGEYDEKLSQYIEKNINLNFKPSLDKSTGNIDYENLMNKAREILDQKTKEIHSNTKLDLVEKADKEKTKFHKYFKDKEDAISKIAIDNIRESKQKEMQQQKVKEKIRIDKKKNLIPKIKLFAVAKVSVK